MPEQTATHDNRPGRGGRVVLAVTRVWLPVAIAAVGIVGVVVGGGKDNVVAGAGVALVIAALIVWMVNWMYRLSVQSNRERETEEAARDYYDLHGHWPDE